MRLLLTHGYFMAEDPKEQQIMKPYAPLGILYLSSHLRSQGFDVEIYDSTFGSRDELFRHDRHGAAGSYRHLWKSDDAGQRAGDHGAGRKRLVGSWCWAGRSHPTIPKNSSPPERT